MPAAPPAGKKKRVELTAEQHKEKLKRRRETDAARRAAKRANPPAAAAAAAAPKPKPAAEVKVVRHTALLVAGLQDMFPGRKKKCAHFVKGTLNQCPGGEKVLCSNGGTAEHQLKMHEVRDAMYEDDLMPEDMNVFFNEGLEYTFKCLPHFEGSEYFHEKPRTHDGRPVYPCMFCPMKGTAAHGGAVPIPMPGSVSSGHEYVDGKRVTVARIPAEHLDDLAPEEMPDLKAYLDGFPKVKYEEVTVTFTMKKTATGKWGSATIAIEDDDE